VPCVRIGGALPFEIDENDRGRTVSRQHDLIALERFVDQSEESLPRFGGGDVAFHDRSVYVEFDTSSSGDRLVRSRARAI
jgi:hypothetical protein